MRSLWAAAGVAFHLITFQSYHTPWYKLTGWITNSPTGRWLDIGETDTKCNIQLRGQFWWKGSWIFKTSVAAEYPVSFGTNFAIQHEAALTMKEQALREGRPVPMADKLFDSGALAGKLPWEMGPGQIQDMEYLDCPDQKEPYVCQGYGSVKGLSEAEHMKWAQGIEHPDMSRMEDMCVDWDLRAAADFERDHNVEQIDEHRSRCLNELLWYKIQSEGLRQQWLEKVPAEIKETSEKFDGPVADYIEGVAKSEDAGASTPMQVGFEFVGKMED